MTGPWKSDYNYNFVLSYLKKKQQPRKSVQLPCRHTQVEAAAKCM